jgi:hypothetical protein
VEADVVAEKVLDPDLVVWLRRDSGETRELIVDALLPARMVTFGRRGGGRLRPTGIRSAAGNRRRLLHQLEAELAQVLDTPPTVLESAGALAVRATGPQARAIANHPLIKAIRPNRRLYVR